ncbi:MAG: NAD-dependent epimerase/dehydratase family protein [Paracoccaceae bacterium]|jgi:2'-hydroxyisoflavone reductase|nr:NAD-dependent epimerase/dehydratase family protein [Paracoccaceae bacterium]
MRCLVVGGTGFLGGAITNTLVSAGHSVAILTRGKTENNLPTEVEQIRGDRYEDLQCLSGRQFDWVFDTCAYSPNAVEKLLQAVNQDISRYILISSISAYSTFFDAHLDETAIVPTANAKDYDLADAMPIGSRSSAYAYGPSYGPLKRACEIEAHRILAGRTTSLRVGLLVGAGDYSDRLTWWVRRIDQAPAKGQIVPAPAPRHRPVQLIDVRDVAKFAHQCATNDLGGIWNVTSQPERFEDILKAIHSVCTSDAEISWVSEKAIVEAGIEPWSDIPMMAPNIPEFRHFLNVSTEKARSAGLTIRPLSETLTPLLEWDRQRRDVALKVGMTQEQEAKLIG